MDRKLSRYFLSLLVVVLPLFILAQNERRYGEDDYKDKEQFDKFYKRRSAIASWQINQLKEGALVVRLKTNSLLISSLIKAGNTRLAKEKQLETDGVNMNIMQAFLRNYSFSKVYFIYTNSSDSLLNGARQNIFLDSNLAIDPTIVMKETFYLLAERDYSYNSSIGFVKEDSARFVKENGNAVREAAVVVKNKYGHQLKRPFPYFVPDRTELKLLDSSITFINIRGQSVLFNVVLGKKHGAGGVPARITAASDKTENSSFDAPRLRLYIPRYLTYRRLSVSISNFNEELKAFYYHSPGVQKDKINPDVLPFLY